MQRARRVFRPADMWVGMPEFIQEKQEPYHRLTIRPKRGGGEVVCRFSSEEDLQEFGRLVGRRFISRATKEVVVDSREVLSDAIGQVVTDRTKSIWHPAIVRGLTAHIRVRTKAPVLPRYPVYIVSKSRAKNGLTWKALDKMGVPYKVIVEAEQLEDYAAEIGRDNLLVLPKRYLLSYDTCDSLGATKSRGPGAARNFALDHSKRLGYKRHWVLDDNLDDFHRLHRNVKAPVRTGATFAACEDFVDRYDNIPIAGMNYYSFCKSTDAVPPLVFNTRIYSCLLIDNHAGYRWRGRYNEDTDICLRVLKDGLCTVQFNAFLCGKVTTQRMRGGNSAEFYDKEGTKAKSQMLEDLHPDVSRVVWKFNRWHHHVDYSPYRFNCPIPAKGVDLSELPEVDNYGMEFV